MAGVDGAEGVVMGVSIADAFAASECTNNDQINPLST
jgi:hypothetical protein